ncbi:MAG: T9SS type A sorting domain-containing protein [Chitinispirillaceae bacterium]|jgi:xylan 1,4-beta-xylosidase
MGLNIRYRRVLCALLFVAGAGFLSVSMSATTTLTVDGSVKQGNIPHFWSACVGTGTMEYCLKPAWITAARIGAKEAGLQRVRGHGILIHWNNVDNIHVGTSPNWSFSVIDQIYDTLIACGLRPVVELDFMPTSLQSNGVTSPPNNYTTYKSFIAALAQNLESRYGAAEVRKWYWEVWNEYDYSGFWNSDAAHYYTMYDSASAGVRSVDTNIIIGGPATTGNGPLQNFWNSCNAYGIKFLSNHQYGNGPGATSDPVNIRNDNRTRSTVIKGTGKSLSSLNTEYNSTYSGQGGNSGNANCVSMDSHINAAFVAKCVKLIIADCISGSNLYPNVLSYWALSDCFDEWGGNNLNSYIEGNGNIPFAEVFGLINYQGLRKATFTAFKMLNAMGTVGLSLTGGSGDADGIDGFATVNADSSVVAILVYSHYTNYTTTSADNTASLTINHLPFANGQTLYYHHFRVDSLHNNPYAVWESQGKPATPSTAQWNALYASDGRNGLDSLEQSTTLSYTGASIVKSFAMPRFAVSLLTYSTHDIGKLGSVSIRTPVQSSVDHAYLSVKGVRLMVNSPHESPVNIFVYSANGRLLKKYRITQQSFDLSKGLVKGLYCIEAETIGARIVKKIVVQ